jgi:hypothetical protein
MPGLNRERAAGSVVPYRLALLVEALLFHRRVLFSAGFLFPWDFRAVHLPLATLIADSFRHGHWPLWDPFTYCGMPISANIQAAAFYPPVAAASLAAAWLGPDAIPRLLAISMVTQMVFAGWCTLALLRRLDARPGAAWIGATVYQLGCFFAAQAEHMGAVQAAAWLPLIWLCVVELSQGGKRKWLAALAVALAMTVLAGLPQVALAAFVSALVLALLLALWRVSGWKLPAQVLLASAWALLLAAVQFVPTAEFTANSVAKYRAEWLGSGGGMAPSALVSLIDPNYWSVFDLAKFHGPTDPTFLYLYSSLFGLLLAAAAVVWKPAVTARVFAILLAVFTFLMLGDKTPPGRAALLALPDFVRIGIHPEYFFCVFSLALAVLAGLGADRFLRSTRLQVAAGILVACDLILVSSGRPMNTASRQRDPGFTQNSADGSRELVDKLRALTAGAVPPYRYDARPGVPFTWSSSAPILGIPTANGCDPMAPERTIELRRAFAPGPRWGTCYQVVDAGSPAVGLMNTRAVLSMQTLQLPGYRLAGKAAGYKIYENLRVLPRFFFVSQVRRAKDLAEAGPLVRAAEFDPSLTAVVEAPGETAETVAPGAVRVVSYQPTEIRLETESAAAGFLVAADSWYPGWQAFVDGRPVRLYATDAAFRGIRTPAGRHGVEMRFVPVTLYWSAAISGIALLMTALVFVWPFGTATAGSGPTKRYGLMRGNHRG